MLFIMIGSFFLILSVQNRDSTQSLGFVCLEVLVGVFVEGRCADIDTICLGLPSFWRLGV